MHHLRLVHEARQNIAQEIRDNQQNLAKAMSSLPREEDQLEKLLKVISAEEKAGAVAHMVCDKVRRYSQIYALRQMFNGSMDHYLESRRDMYAFLTRMDLPYKPSAAEFRRREARHRVGD